MQMQLGIVNGTLYLWVGNFFYHCIYGSMFCIPLFNSVNYVFLLLFYFSQLTVHLDIIKVLNILLSN
jgi:hypothetical protein